MTNHKITSIKEAADYYREHKDEIMNDWANNRNKSAFNFTMDLILGYVEYIVSDANKYITSKQESKHA